MYFIRSFILIFFLFASYFPLYHINHSSIVKELPIQSNFSEQEWDIKPQANRQFHQFDLDKLIPNVKEAIYFPDYVNLSENKKRIGLFAYPNKTINGSFVNSFEQKRAELSKIVNVAVFDTCQVYRGGNGLSTVYSHVGRLNKFTAHIYKGFLMGTPGGMAYSHYITDNIMIMYYIEPKFVEDKVLIISKLHRRYALDVLPILGFDLSKNVLLLESKEAVFVDELYSFVFSGLLDLNGVNILRKFTKKLQEHYGVSNVKPTDYLLTNRQKGKRRHIVGFEHLVQTIRKKWPSIDWKVVISKEEPMGVQVIRFTKALFAFGPPGSNFMNIMFMERGSVVLLFRDLYTPDLQNNAFGAAKGVWVLQVPYDGWEHMHFKIDPKRTPIDEKRVIEFMGHCFKILETQQMVKNTSLINLLEN